MTTDSLEEVKQAEKYGRIVRTRFGGYQLQFPTKLNEELTPLLSKDWDMDVVEEGDTLRVILTRDKLSQKKGSLNV